ncbi:hypothetical protein ACFQL7_03695 [Halocatena marina]|uniref:Uncharacterized protein n=1 Tax=Halocatena marina TaxID=2934937 RepID=A0ABD5YN72_9EURY
MATRTTDPEWEYAVIGTTLCVSVGAVLLGVFQLVDGESVGTVPLFSEAPVSGFSFIAGIVGRGELMTGPIRL